jgi:hypothetical protein
MEKLPGWNFGTDRTPTGVALDELLRQRSAYPMPSDEELNSPNPTRRGELGQLRLMQYLANAGHQRYDEGKKCGKFLRARQSRASA